jgi:hypothetical protein
VQAKRLVSRIFEDKVAADRVDDQSANPRTTFSAFLKDWLIHE